ncbi:hypothetical protein [Acinetobacter pollinis]|uniref:Uncharacterized protein n=1 Tax=Acinetobacter pollinis TaxID=2605270 RepID=A0ABU6DQH2_9GAMM|nr:hypothetical protein [Acinetobacter pollinis]MEB5475960.1 hypothetical protein [Acinetobacter pollinis]
MKANEFIKKYGVDKAKKYLQQNDQLDHVYMGNGFYIKDLKCLIESHELVISYGGLAMAKRQYDCFDNARKSVGVSQSSKVSALGKAIADVESCQ